MVIKANTLAKEFLEGANLGDRARIVLDIQMQGITGFDLQGELASKGIRMPVIVVSAHDDAETRKRTRELGAAAFFRKPVDGEALVDTIHWIMGSNKHKSPPLILNSQRREVMMSRLGNSGKTWLWWYLAHGTYRK
jgi:FixJ family two-component response regulator